MGRDKPVKRTTAKAKSKKDDDEVLSKKAAEARKKELVHGDGMPRLKVLDSLHSTGVLTSSTTSRDTRIEQVTLSLHGREFFRDTTIQISHGRRYGVIGANGSGKTTLLAAIACRELPIPDHIDIWFVHEEAAPTETSALQAVVDTAAKEVARIEKLMLKLAEEDAEANAEVLEALGDKLDKMDPTSFIPDAGALLHGLGFTDVMMAKATKDMSGGWRMRVALAQALFKKPTLLVLDEPTNHLDLGACVWLEEYLAQYPSTIILTSHSEDFMNTVCTEIMQITDDQRLVYWGGNYEQYVRTRAELEVNQMKAYEKEQSDIAHLQEFIRSCGTYSNMRRQADSKQKIIDKMKEKGLTEKPRPDPTFMFNFPESESLAPPVLAFDQMSFSYSGKKEDYLYKNVDFGIDLDSRVALVGPNGAGKSTLLKLMRGDLEAVEGSVKRHSHLRIASYNQHSAEVLPLDKSPLQFFQDKFDAEAEQKGEPRKSEQQWRQLLGKYGVTGELQKRTMVSFSDGQKSRVVFALMSMVNPHLLLLDEPTNHLDMACIDALAEAILKFTGGTVLVSHDFRLIDKVAKEIWVCDGGVKPWKGDIKSYKSHLSKEMRKAAKARKMGMGSCAGANAGGVTNTFQNAVAAMEAAQAEESDDDEKERIEAEKRMEEKRKKEEELAQKKAEEKEKRMAKIAERDSAKVEAEAAENAAREAREAEEAAAKALAEKAAAADSDGWTPEQQTALEAALVKYPASIPANDRWNQIAAAVPGQTRKQCVARYKWLREQLAAKPAEEKAAEEQAAPEAPAAAPEKAEEAAQEEAPAPEPEKPKEPEKKLEDEGLEALPQKDQKDKELPPWLQKKARAKK